MSRTNVKTLTMDGMTLTIREWAEKTGIAASVLHNRLVKGWSPEETLQTPTGKPAISKDVAELELNDMLHDQLPSKLRAMLPHGLRTHRYGSYLRTECRQQFNDWYNNVFVKNHERKP